MANEYVALGMDHAHLADVCLQEINASSRDADGAVRKTRRTVLIQLFRTHTRYANTYTLMHLKEKHQMNTQALHRMVTNGSLDEGATDWDALEEADVDVSVNSKRMEDGIESISACSIGIEEDARLQAALDGKLGAPPPGSTSKPAVANRDTRAHERARSPEPGEQRLSDDGDCPEQGSVDSGGTVRHRTHEQERGSGSLGRETAVTDDRCAPGTAEDPQAVRPGAGTRATAAGRGVSKRTARSGKSPLKETLLEPA